MPPTLTEKPATKSPIKTKPLRTPGQSLQQQLDNLYIDQILFWSLMIAFAWVMTALEIFRWIARSPVAHQSVIAFIFCATVLTIFAAFKIRKAPPIIHRLRQGLDGEIFVGQFLDEHCRQRRYKVLHDIQADGFNIDHLLIGPGGIFTIETKTPSKPAQGDATIQYNGTSVLINGHTPDRDPIAQSQANARHIADLLSRSTARPTNQIPIHPVVLYPGWYIKGKSSGRPVWVLNENSFLTFLDNEDDRRTPDDIPLFYTRLESQQRSPS